MTCRCENCGCVCHCDLGTPCMCDCVRCEHEETNEDNSS